MTQNNLHSNILHAIIWQYSKEATMEDQGIDWLKLGLGVALPGIGGVIGSLLPSVMGEGGSTLAGTGADLRNQAEQLAITNLYNQAGRTGAEARSSFDTALAGLTNSAEARKAYNAQNQLAGQLLAGQQAAMNATNRNAQNVAGAQTRQLTDIARNQNLGGGGIAALARTIGQNTGDTLLSANAQNAQAAQSATTGAANMMGQAAQGLAQDLATRNDIFVKPFYSQSSGIGNQALSLLPGYKQVQEQQKIISQPLYGLGTALGGIGRGFAGAAFGQAGAELGEQKAQSLGGLAGKR